MTNRIGAVLVVSALAACGGGDSLGDSPDASGGGGGGQAPANFTVDFVTTAGNFSVDVTRAWSPNGADRFYELVQNGFYDETKFFRVVPGFIVQWGINGDPATQAMWVNRNIEDDPVVESNRRGYITFATAGRDTRTTQLFINYSDNAFLDGMGFSPFGVVSGTGMSVVDTVNAEYGESPNQAQIQASGNAYLDANFPNLDAITTLTVQ